MRGPYGWRHNPGLPRLNARLFIIELRTDVATKTYSLFTVLFKAQGHGLRGMASGAWPQGDVRGDSGTSSPPRLKIIVLLIY